MDGKNVGVITLFHVRNIGAVLQAYSTKKIIENLGYNPVYFKVYGIKHSFLFFKSDMGNIRPYNTIFLLRKFLKFHNSFKVFNECKLNNFKIIDYKAIILGSDSIWVPNNRSKMMPSAFFGNINNHNIGTYAASSGGITDIDKYSDEQKQALSNIKNFTVRDIYTKKLIMELTGKEAEIVLDPTLLIDWKEELKRFNNDNFKYIKDKYIVVYGGFTDQMVSSIKEIARSNNCKIINVGSFDKRFKNNIAVSPFEFVYVLNRALFVVTSMFHGIMISLGLRKKFVYMENDENRTKKLISQMKMLGFDDQNWIYDINKSFSSYSCSYPEDFEYTLKRMQSKSILQIKKIVEGEGE